MLARGGRLETALAILRNDDAAQLRGAASPPVSYTHLDVYQRQGLLDAFAEPGASRSRTLVLNDENEVARQLLGAPGTGVFAAGLRSLYLNAVMLAGEGLRQSGSAALSGALGSLLELALRKEQP